MNCKKAQRLYDDLAEGRVSEPLATELRRHFDECSDCRVLHQRAVRLQQLLSLKRHEQPAPAYFDNFLHDFHHRLALETMRPTWRERFWESIRLEIAPAWRYGVATVCALLLVVGIFQYSHANNSTAPVRSNSASTTALVSTTTPSTAEPNMVMTPAAWHAPTSHPHYVLEHIAVTPASYEMASIRF